MAYDSERQVMVLFGGRAITSTGELADTWEYDGEEWRQIHPPQSPSPRAGQLMAYDPNREVMVLYGGEIGEEDFSDTWEYDGTTWRERSFSDPTPDLFPYTSAMVYDARHQTMLLFGVKQYQSTDYEMWHYNGVEWTDTTTPLPDVWGTHYGGLIAPKLVYDTKRQVIVLQGGHNWTYEWDGQRWYVAVESGSPQALPEGFGWAAGMAYDERRQVTVIFGGRMGNSVTWEYDGQQWLAANPVQLPPMRELPLIAYDTAREVVVMFGGVRGGLVLNDTWEYDGTTWTLKIKRTAATDYPGHIKQMPMTVELPTKVTP